MELMDPTDAPTPTLDRELIAVILERRLMELDEKSPRWGRVSIPHDGSFLQFTRKELQAQIDMLRADAAASRAPSVPKGYSLWELVKTWKTLRNRLWDFSRPVVSKEDSILSARASELNAAIVDLENALAAGARAVPSAQEEMDRLRIEVETTKTLLAAWQKRAMEAERINPHGRMLTPEELEPFITEMRERTIPAIVKAVHQRQKDAAAMRHIPLSACAVPETQADKWSYEKAAAEEGHVVDAGILHPAVRETQEAPKSLLRPAYRPSENTESNDGERLSAQIGRVKAALLREDSQQARTLFDAASGLCIAASAIKKYLPFTDAARSAVTVQDALTTPQDALRDWLRDKAHDLFSEAADLREQADRRVAGPIDPRIAFCENESAKLNEWADALADLIEAAWRRQAGTADRRKSQRRGEANTPRSESLPNRRNYAVPDRRRKAGEQP